MNHFDHFDVLAHRYYGQGVSYVVNHPVLRFDSLGVLVSWCLGLSADGHPFLPSPFLYRSGKFWQTRCADLASGRFVGFGVLIISQVSQRLSRFVDHSNVGMSASLEFVELLAKLTTWKTSGNCSTVTHDAPSRVSRIGTGYSRKE